MFNNKIGGRGREAENIIDDESTPLVPPRLVGVDIPPGVDTELYVLLSPMEKIELAKFQIMTPEERRFHEEIKIKSEERKFQMMTPEEKLRIEEIKSKERRFQMMTPEERAAERMEERNSQVLYRFNL